MSIDRIEEGYEVFASDGTPPIGAVRQVATQSNPSLIIYIENAGDFVVPLAAVKAVHAQKVILDVAKLDHGTREAIRHAHDSEDPDL